MTYYGGAAGETRLRLARPGVWELYVVVDDRGEIRFERNGGRTFPGGCESACLYEVQAGQDVLNVRVSPHLETKNADSMFTVAYQAP